MTPPGGRSKNFAGAKAPQEAVTKKFVGAKDPPEEGSKNFSRAKAPPNAGNKNFPGRRPRRSRVLLVGPGKPASYLDDF